MLKFTLKLLMLVICLATPGLADEPVASVTFPNGKLSLFWRVEGTLPALWMVVDNDKRGGLGFDKPEQVEAFADAYYRGKARFPQLQKGVQGAEVHSTPPKIKIYSGEAGHDLTIEVPRLGKPTITFVVPIYTTRTHQGPERPPQLSKDFEGFLKAAKAFKFPK